MGHQFLRETPRFLGRPELGAVVDVEAHARPALPGSARRPEDEVAAVRGEGGRDAGQVEELGSSQVLGVEDSRGHTGGCRAPTVVVDPRLLADLFAQVEAGGVIRYPPHPRGVHPFAADAVEDKLTGLVVPEEADPPGGDAEAGEGYCDVRLGAPDLELQARGVPQPPWPRGDAEDHRLARRYDAWQSALPYRTAMCARTPAPISCE